MPPPGGFRWNARLSRYQRQNGRIVSRADVRGVLDTAIEREAQRMRQLGGAFQRREISLREFQAGMREAIKESHLYATAAARGGWDRMSRDDILSAGREIGRQYRYLQRLSAGLSDGSIPADGRFMQRLSLYGRASRAQFGATDRREQVERNGATEERNIRHASDSCATCVDASAAGWVPVGTLPLPGSTDRICRQNCKCQLDYRGGRTRARRAALKASMASVIGGGGRPWLAFQ